MRNEPSLPSGPIRAAQYIRMSTDHQRYSADNQAAAIEAYAAAHGYDVVQTYADLGKSGLTLAGRPALRQLLADIEHHRVSFRAVLVYDVSRWGRFQDPDEAAACEASCKRGGVMVHYCIEAFDNDGSPTAAILKSIRRIMAAEYSRDLSVKIHQAQRRVASLGFVPSRWRPLGMQRLAVDSRGVPVRLLAPGELSPRGCRVRYVPGPSEEVNQVRRIFRLYGTHQYSRSRIARILNSDGVSSPNGYAWTYAMISRVLRGEIYIGNYVFGQSTAQLTRIKRRLPPEAWVRATGAVEPVIGQALFAKVQRRLATTAPRSDEKLLADLRRLIATYGRVSCQRLKDEPGMANANVFIRRFGSLAEAYRRIGYVSPSTRQAAALVQASQIHRNDLMLEIASIFRAFGHVVAVDRTRTTLHVDEEFHINIRSRRRMLRKPVWVYNQAAPGKSALTLLVRLDLSTEPVDYCLLAGALFPRRNVVLSEVPPPRPGLEVFQTLDEVYGRSMRVLGRPTVAKASAEPQEQFGGSVPRCRSSEP